MRLRYKIMLAVITVGIGVCLMAYQSYALWVATYTSGENIVSVGCFDIEFTEQTSSIALNNTYPVSDAKGLSSTPYTFTITNKCTVDASYDVTLNTLTTNTMEKGWLKYALQKSSEAKPSTGTNLGTIDNYNTATEELQIPNLDESIIIESGTLKGRSSAETDDGESITYNLYLWMDETTGNEAMNTRFEGSINVLTAATKVEPTAAETILAKGETDELKFDKTTDNNLRYIGANPNNYVSFNNELWRIIGVFNNIDDGTGTKETRLKIIRSEPIGNYSWDYDSTGSYYNDWTSSQLKDLLNNGAYYNRTTGSYYNNSTTATSVDFTSNGLTEEAKTMISDAKWNLGGLSGTSSDENYYQTAIPSAWYTNERGTEVYSGRPTEWIGSIGLMYPSDYGYATSGGSTTNRTTCLNTELYNWNGSSVSDCKNNDWLYDSSKDQWTLTPISRYLGTVFYVYSRGNVSSNHANLSYDVFPALYLSSNVKISGGEGTENSPYQLSL